MTTGERTRLSPGSLPGSGYLVLAAGYALLGAAKGLGVVPGRGG